jgi:hypothetical protein
MDGWLVRRSDSSSSELKALDVDAQRNATTFLLQVVAEAEPGPTATATADAVSCTPPPPGPGGPASNSNPIFS